MINISRIVEMYSLDY